MKKLTLTSLLIVITLGFSSCSVEEDPLLVDNTSSKLFEKVTVKRDASGSYFLDMQINEGAGVDIIDDKQKNGKDLNFYLSDQKSKRSINESMSLNGQQSLSVGLNNTVNNIKSTLTVYDDDIKFNRTTEDDHLASYSITDNGDGTYDLDFTVDPNIEVEFIQNEDTGKYQIHLEPGDSSQSDFSVTLNKELGEDLKIEFINYFSDEGNRSVTSSTKPVIEVEEGGEVGA